MIYHIINHSLNTITCTLDGMEIVIEMTAEVETVSSETVGYLLINSIAATTKGCDAIAKEVENGEKY